MTHSNLVCDICMVACYKHVFFFDILPVVVRVLENFHGVWFEHCDIFYF